mgnify:FL=1
MKNVTYANCLATNNEKLSQEWHLSKNNGLTPLDVTIHSGRKVWWKCNKGHEWQAVIASRSKGSNCPYCSGRYAIKGENDLETVYPQLANEWHPTKNNPLKPNDVTKSSTKIVWWKCNEGHEWNASVNNRSRGQGCPFCSGKRVVKGINDLELHMSDQIAKEWDYDKNGDITPSSVTIFSNKKVWWKCNKDHEWQAEISRRTKGNSNCPYCSGRKAIIGQNDLITLNPLFIKEWNYERNTNISPDSVSAYSNKKTWWKCELGHEWQATISKRSIGRNCPYCAGERPIVGENDLKTMYPLLAEEWNYDKNRNLSPEHFKGKSGKKVYWKCKICGYEWRASIVNRTNGKSNCPNCK